MKGELCSHLPNVRQTAFVQSNWFVFSQMSVVAHSFVKHWAKSCNIQIGRPWKQDGNHVLANASTAWKCPESTLLFWTALCTVMHVGKLWLGVVIAHGWPPFVGTVFRIGYGLFWKIYPKFCKCQHNISQTCILDLYTGVCLWNLG